MQNKDSKFVLQQTNEKVDIKEQILKFYFEKFSFVLHGFSRSKVLSAIYLTIYYAQVISLSFGSAFLTEYASKANAIKITDIDSAFEDDQKGIQNIHSQVELSNSDMSVHYYVYKLLKYARIYPILYDIYSNTINELQLVILIVFLVINIILLVHPFIKMLINIASQSTSQKLHLKREFLSPNSEKQDESYQISWILQILSLFDYSAMLMYGLYRYILTIPNLIFSMQYIIQTDSTLGEQVLAGINLTLAIVNTLVIAIHDFDVSFMRRSEDTIEGEDYLSRKMSFQSILNLIGDIVKCGVFSFSYSVNQYFIICLISFVFTLMEYAEFSLSFVYLRLATAKTNFIYLNILTFFNGIIILFGKTTISDDCSCILVVALSLPIISLFSIFIFEFVETKIFNWSIENASKSASAIDIYSRTVQSNSQNIDLKEYLYSNKGVSFEAIVVRHQNQCSSSSCFCKPLLEQLANGQGEKSELRKKFIDEYLLLLFNQFLSRSKVNQYNMVRFQYLALLVDSVRCPLKSNIESIQLSSIKTSSMGFREKIILNTLKLRSYNLFERNVISIEKQKSQSIGGSYYQTDTDLFDIIRFDMLLSYFQKSTRAIYQLKRDFYHLIASEEVNLIQTKLKGEQILNFLDQVFDLFHLTQFTFFAFISFQEKNQKPKVQHKIRQTLINLFIMILFTIVKNNNTNKMTNHISKQFSIALSLKQRFQNFAFKHLFIFIFLVTQCLGYFTFGYK